MDTTWMTWAGLVAGIAALRAGWGYFAAIAVKIMDLIVCRVTVANGTASAVMALCIKHGRRSPLSLRVFGGQDAYVHTVGHTQLVAFESISSDPILFWFKGRPLIVKMVGNSSTIFGVGDGVGMFGPVGLFCLRGTLDLDALVNDAVCAYNAAKRPGANVGTSRRRFFTRYLPNRQNEKAGVTVSPPSEPPEIAHAANPSSGSLDEGLRMGALRLLRWKPEDLQWSPPPGRSAFDDYPFPPVVQGALQELRQWLDNEKWFRSKGVPWRRGWLLHGKPGTGKSTMVRSIGQEFDLPVFVFDLASMDNSTMREAWTIMQSYTPCIALIEDIDGVFHGRQNVAPVAQTRDALSFDCLLNCISGVGQNDGVFLIVTTNHTEHLDPALGVPTGDTSTRPGRLDRAIFLGDMGEPERRRLAGHILADWPHLVEPTVRAGYGETAAQFQYRCAQLALRLFWEERQLPVQSQTGPVLRDEQDGFVRSRCVHVYAESDS